MKGFGLAILFFVSVFALCFFYSSAVDAEDIFVPNYDESSVPTYTLPDPLMTIDGKIIDTPDQWINIRRREILRLYSEELYGFVPDSSCGQLYYEETESCDEALGGVAIRKQGTLYLNWPEKNPKVNLLLYLPAEGEGPFPVFCGLNFEGNLTTSTEPEIFGRAYRYQNETRESEALLRGKYAQRWPAKTIIKRGYALVTACYEDIVPDFPDPNHSLGAWPLIESYVKKNRIPERVAPAAISAWSWGLSRIFDVLQTFPKIDASRVAVLGHSRLGKTALWAGANDPRFALVISNDSGCGGASLYRRRFGETFEFMNSRIYWWFCENSRKYNGKVDELPFDQHYLISLIAPRPVYIASAVEDGWADPKGEFLSAFYANGVYQLLGTDGIAGANEWPKVDTPVGGVIHYHVRRGGHDVTSYDWERYLDFADRYMK